MHHCACSHEVKKQKDFTVCLWSIFLRLFAASIFLLCVKHAACLNPPWNHTVIWLDGFQKALPSFGADAAPAQFSQTSGFQMCFSHKNITTSLTFYSWIIFTQTWRRAVLCNNMKFKIISCWRDSVFIWWSSFVLGFEEHLNQLWWIHDWTSGIFSYLLQSLWCVFVAFLTCFEDEVRVRVRWGWDPWPRAGVQTSGWAPVLRLTSNSSKKTTTIQPAWYKIQGGMINRCNRYKKKPHYVQLSGSESVLNNQ